MSNLKKKTKKSVTEETTEKKIPTGGGHGIDKSPNDLSPKFRKPGARGVIIKLSKP